MVPHFYFYFLIISDIRHLSGVCLLFVFLFPWTMNFIHFEQFLGRAFLCFISTVFWPPNLWWILYSTTSQEIGKSMSTPRQGMEAVPRRKTANRLWILWNSKHLITSGLGLHFLVSKVEKYSNSCSLVKKAQNCINQNNSEAIDRKPIKTGKNTKRKCIDACE